MAQLRAGLQGTVAQSTASKAGGSVYFNSYRDQSLSRSWATSGNRRTWTMSAWMKIVPSSYSQINHRCWFGADAGSSDIATRLLCFVGDASDQLQIDANTSLRDSSSVYRDPTGWYHHVIKLDTTESSARNQLTYYINGSVVTTWNTETAVTQNQEMGWNRGHPSSVHLIGANQAAGPGQWFDGYLSEMIFCDSAAFDASYFGYTNPLTGIWEPKNFKQTNGFGNPNNGTTWSSNGSVSGNSTSATKTFDLLFDGQLNTYAEQSGDDVTLTWTPSPAIRVNKTMRINFLVGGNPADTVINSDTSAINVDPATGWVDVPVPHGGMMFSKFEMPRGGSGVYARASAIEIDGYRMLNGAVDNSFYLPFDGSAPVGEDQSGNGNDWTTYKISNSVSIDKATKCFPILNTASGGGVAASGVRPDDDSGNIRLAIPCLQAGSNTTYDVSAYVKGSGSNKSITWAGTTAYDSNGIYGQSIDLERGSSNYLSWSSTDTAPDTGDFTYECWVQLESLNNYMSIMDARDAANDTKGFFWGFDNAGTYYIYYNGSVRITTGSGVIDTDYWYHCAVTRTGGVLYLWLDGSLVGTYDTSNSDMSTDVTRLGSDVHSAGYYLDGMVNDARIYIGKAKYTANFLPASPSPNIMPDSPHGVSLGSRTTNPGITTNTHGSVSFTEGENPYMDFDPGSDIAIGTGDFTIEAYVYHTGGADDVIISDDAGCSFLYGAGGTLRFYMASGSNLVSSSIAYISNRWVHVAAARESGTLRMFQDGVEVYDASYTHNISTFTNPTDIGSYHSGSSYWCGHINSLRVTVGQALYTANYEPPKEPLTTTSQSATASNVKLLCCQDSTSPTKATVAPNAIAVYGNVQAVGFNPFDTDTSTPLIPAYSDIQPTRYPTFNPLVASQQGNLGAVYRDGLLKISGDGDTNYYDLSACATQLLPLEGKYVFEYQCLNDMGTGNPGRRDAIGVYDTSKQQDYITYVANSVGYQSWDGDAVTEESDVQGTGLVYSDGDVASCAIDCATGRVWFATNGNWNGDPAKGTNPATTLVNKGDLVFSESNVHNSTSTSFTSEGYINFGQRPFRYPPPEGFGPLCAANDQQIANPKNYYQGVLYTGSGNNTVNTISDFNFQPDLLIFKQYDATQNWPWYDSVRGTSLAIRSNNTDEEKVFGDAVVTPQPGGFKITGSNTTGINGSSENMIVYGFKAGGNKGTFNRDGVAYATAAAAGLSAGDTTINGASIGTKQGFSIIKYTGPNDTNNHTVAHGLDKAPDLIITKNLDRVCNWDVYHSYFDSGDYMTMTADATRTNGYNGAPTATVINTEHDYSTNENEEYIAYCWHNVPGLQKVGKYVSNNQSSQNKGPMVLTGFRPAQVVIRIDGADGWHIFDNQRDPTNGISKRIWWSSNAAQSNNVFLDFLANGFKLVTNDSGVNGSSGTSYYFIAWADQCASPIYGGQSNAY